MPAGGPSLFELSQRLQPVLCEPGLPVCRDDRDRVGPRDSHPVREREDGAAEVVAPPVVSRGCFGALEDAAPFSANAAGSTTNNPDNFVR